MTYRRIVISSGHGRYIRGASGILEEVVEARKVVETVAAALRERGVEVTTFHDDTSENQNDNLNAIVDFHNQQQRELDVSVHFNAYVETDDAMGTETLYVSQDELAGKMSRAISASGELIDRGGRFRGDLFFLNNTAMPSILIEVCFVDSEADAEMYRLNFDAICGAVAGVLGGEEETEQPPPDSGDGGDERPPLRPRPPARVNIETSGNVVVIVNGVPVQ